MLASMSETTWGDVFMSELPTGTVTLLLADVEGSTRLWENQPEAMKSAVERLDLTLANAVAAHRGVRPVEQGEGDSFVIAFARASDAVACALELQQAPLAPIKLRIGVHTGEVEVLPNDIGGVAVHAASRIMALASASEIIVSSVTRGLVEGSDLRFEERGRHAVKGVERPIEVYSLAS
jgi:class 3 adenylate cyclase